MTDGEKRSGVRDESKPTPTPVAPDLGALSIVAEAHLFQVVINVAVDDQHIRPAVVVEVGQGAAPADIGQAIPDGPRPCA